MAKSRQFRDASTDDFSCIESLSDADLERLMAASPGGGGRSSGGVEALEPGERVAGTVVDVRAGEVLLELDQKTHGLIEASDFAGEGEPPALGSRLEAVFLRYDAARDLALLSVRGARREIVWDELRPGLVVDGRVAATNRGGLTLDVKGVRAFLPVSQIELQRVEDLAPYVGRTLRVEVTAFDRAAENVVVSRRAVLEREAEEMRGQALARLSEGEVLTGTVVRISEHGAFIDLGGVEGLLHQSKIHGHQKEIDRSQELAVGSRLEVEVVRIDRERGRVSLDFHRVAGSDWKVSIASYSPGDEATGWVSRLTPDGAVVALEEGVEGLIPRTFFVDLDRPPQKGSIVRTRIRKIDHASRRIELEPLD